MLQVSHLHYKPVTELHLMNNNASDSASSIPVPTFHIPTVELGKGTTISQIINGTWQIAGGHGPVDESKAANQVLIINLRIDELMYRMRDVCICRTRLYFL